MKTIGDKLKELRLAKNMTVEEMAEKTGSSVGYITIMEDIDDTISVGSLMMMCQAFGYSPGMLIDDYWKRIQPEREPTQEEKEQRERDRKWVQDLGKEFDMREAICNFAIYQYYQIFGENGDASLDINKYVASYDEINSRVKKLIDFIAVREPEKLKHLTANKDRE